MDHDCRDVQPQLHSAKLYPLACKTRQLQKSLQLPPKQNSQAHLDLAINLSVDEVINSSNNTRISKAAVVMILMTNGARLGHFI